MAPILLTVQDVVDEVHGTRQRTKDDERDDRFDHRRSVVEPLRKHESAEDEQILRPLTWTE
jgi:hypothetical protein